MKKLLLLPIIIGLQYSIHAQADLFSLRPGGEDTLGKFLSVARLTVDSTYYATGDLKWAGHSHSLGWMNKIITGDTVTYAYFVHDNSSLDSMNIITYKGIPVRIDSVRNWSVGDMPNLHASHKALISDTIYIKFKKHEFGRKHPLHALNNTTIPIYRFMLKGCLGKIFYFTSMAGYIFVRFKLFRSGATANITQFAEYNIKSKQEFIFKLYARLMKKKYKYYIW